LIDDHFEYLKKLSSDGVALVVGRTLTTDEESHGMVILIADSEELASAIMNNDPAVKNEYLQRNYFHLNSF
jgi:uncharacterized protein YciI